MEKIHMIGYDAVHPADFIYDMPAHHDRCLLILTNTPSRFWLDGGPRDFPPHQAALFPPGSRIRYGASGGPYGNDWIIFSSDETYVTQFPLVGAPFPVLDPEYCHNLFQLLTWEHTQGGYETVISQLMSVLFTKLEADIRQADSGDYAPALLGLRKSIMIHSQQDWSVAKMARQLHISAGGFKITVFLRHDEGDGFHIRHQADYERFLFFQGSGRRRGGSLSAAGQQQGNA